MKIIKQSPDKFKVSTGCRDVTIYSEITRVGKRVKLGLPKEVKAKHDAALKAHAAKVKEWAEEVVKDPTYAKAKPKAPPTPKQKHRTIYSYEPQYQMTGGYYERVSEATLLKLAECCLSCVEAAEAQRTMIAQVEEAMKAKGRGVDMITGDMTVTQLKAIHKRLAAAALDAQSNK